MSTVATANSRMTFGAMLGMLTTTANVVSSTISTLGDGVDMLQTSVSEMKIQQQIRCENDTAVYEDMYIMQKEQELSSAIIATQEFRKKSPEHATAFDKAQEMLAARKAARKAS